MCELLNLPQGFYGGKKVTKNSVSKKRPMSSPWTTPNQREVRVFAPLMPVIGVGVIRVGVIGVGVIRVGEIRVQRVDYGRM